MRSVHVDYDTHLKVVTLGTPPPTPDPPNTGLVTGALSWAGTANGQAPQGHVFPTPDTTLSVGANYQTIINNNANVGHVFEFAAGTHNITTPLTPSANGQEFQGATNGTPVIVSPTDPNGASLDKSKTLWSEGTPTSVMNGGGTTAGFMFDNTSPTTWTGITIRGLKFQNFPGTPTSSGQAVLGGRYTNQWVIEDCWIVGGTLGVKVGDSMIIRRNRFDTQGIWWVHGFNVGGTSGNPIIIEDNHVFDTNLTEGGGGANVVGDPQWDASMKMANNVGGRYYIVRRNYVRGTHGPAIWFDADADDAEIYDNITVDCGIHDDGSDMPHIFYEINDSHNGAIIRNNWCLGFSAQIRISSAHGTSAAPILVDDNTVDTDDTDRAGIHLTESGRTGGDSNGTTHPAVNTISLAAGRHFLDFIKVRDNVIRKRNATFNQAVPVGGCQNSAPTFDRERNYEWSGNKYEVNAAITTPFKWDTAMNYTTWRTQRAALNSVQDTGPLFDTAGSGSSFVTWSGAKQFPDTVCGWEG